MKVVKRIWTGTTAAERLLLAAALFGVLATVVVAAFALVKRPGDISNPDAAFNKGRLQNDPTKNDKGKKLQTVDWPRFGYDEARTKFLGVQRVRPPYRKLWKYKNGELIELPPVIAGKRMYLIDNDGVFVALDAQTGKVAWKKKLGSLNASSPAYWKGKLLAVNLEPQQVLSVRASDGKVLWKKSLPARSESSPLVHGHHMYFGDEAGNFYALDARNGKTIWQTHLNGSVKAAPAFADGTLYDGDYSGKMYAIRASDGAIRWQTEGLGTGLSSGRFYSTPAVAFGRVYAGNVDNRVYSFDRQTGAIDWTFSAGDYVYSGVAAADGDKIKPSVYFGSHDRHVYSVDAQTGKLNWKAEPGGQVSGPATVIGDVVYVSTFSGNATLGFDLETGRRVFKVDDGQYGPAVSDGVHLFIAGGSDVIAYKPIKIGNYKAKDGEKGIVPPAERRKARGQQPGPNAKKQAKKLKSSPNKGDKGKSGGGKKKGKKKRAAKKKKKPAQKKQKGGGKKGKKQKGGGKQKQEEEEEEEELTVSPRKRA